MQELLIEMHAKRVHKCPKQPKNDKNPSQLRVGSMCPGKKAFGWRPGH